MALSNDCNLIELSYILNVIRKEIAAAANGEFAVRGFAFSDFAIEAKKKISAFGIKIAVVLGMMVSTVTVMAMLAGCAAEEPVPGPDNPTEEGKRVLSFAPFVDGEAPMRQTGATRASVYTPLQEQLTDFAVYGFKTLSDATTQDVIRYGEVAPYLPYEAVYNTESGKWDYDIMSDSREQYMRYWDKSASKYRFEAIAPFRIGGNAVVNAPYNVTVADGHLKIENVRGNLWGNAVVDWMAASHERDYSEAPDVVDTDLRTAEITEYPVELTKPVKLRFHHILSQIEIRAYNDEATNLSITDFTLKVKIPNPAYSTSLPEGDANPRYIDGAIYTKADFESDSEASGYGEWTYSTDTADSTGDIYRLPAGAPMIVTGSDKETANTLVSLVEIPQDVAGKFFEVSISTTKHTFSGTFPLVAPGAWTGGKKYIYYLHLSDNEEIILIDVNIDSFRWKDGNEIGEDENEEQTNW